MFTGIVEEMGRVTSVQMGTKSAKIKITCSVVLSDLKIGDSVATNGVCLTVAEIQGKQLIADVMAETLKRSNLGDLRSGSLVNLERAMAANGRFGGHMVSGNIDGVGTIQAIQKEDIALWYTIKTNPDILRYIVEKGSITIDGISLTVARVERDTFAVSIIPHTAKETILSQKKVGATVNLENDMIGKYVAKLLRDTKGMSKEFLLENGF